MFAPDIRMSLYTILQHDDLLCKVQRLPPLPRESPKPAHSPLKEGPPPAVVLLPQSQRLSFFVTAVLSQIETKFVISFCGWRKGSTSDAVCLSSIPFGHFRYHDDMYLWSSDIRFCKIQTLFKEVALICNYGCASNRHAQICTRKQWGEVYRFGCFNSDKPWAPWTGDADTGVTWQLWKPQFVGYEIHSCLTPTTLSCH